MNVNFPEGWPTWFLIAAAIYLAWQAWKGWRMGVVRAFCRLLAWCGAAVLGWYVGVFVSKAVAPLFPAVQIPAGALSGIGVGLGFLILMTLLPRLLFKKTSDNPAFLGQILYGVGGALLGLVFGLMVLWAVLFGLRALEAMERGRGFALEAASQIASPAHKSPEKPGRPRPAQQSFASPSPPAWEMMPSATLEIIQKWSQVSADPQALERLAEYPDVADLLQHPKIIALGRDEKIIAAAQRRDILALLSHPRLWDLATDPEVARRVRAIDMRAALDHALQEPRPSR